MHIRQIEYILAVNELKNFGLAADKCFITQSTLSTMIARFEEEIGMNIFNRKTKPVTITKEGTEIIRQLKIILKEVDRLNEIVKSLKGELSGTVNMGVIPTVAPYLIPNFLQEFTSKHQGIQFTVSEVTTGKLIENLLNREIDIGIASIPLQIQELIEIPLYDEDFLLYDKASPNDQSSLDISQIDFSRLWLLEEGHCLRTQVVRICGLHEKQASDRNLIYKSGSIDTLLKYVRKNNGITLLPFLASNELPESDRKFLRCFRDPVPARTIGLVVHRHFVKKRILELLQLDIQNKIIPLLSKTYKQVKIISPV